MKTKLFLIVMLFGAFVLGACNLAASTPTPSVDPTPTAINVEEIVAQVLAAIPTQIPPVVNTQVALPENTQVAPANTQVVLPVDLDDPNANSPSWFPKTAKQVIERYQLEMVAVGEVGWCPDGVGGYESNCWRVLREKDGSGSVNTPFWIGAQPDGFWQDGYRHQDGDLRPGNCPIPERTGIPPDFVGFAEGFTIRSSDPHSCDGVASVPVSGTPMTPNTLVGWSSAEEVISQFQISGANVNACTDEENCWDVVPVTAGMFFTITNPAEGCWQDGYRVEPGEVRPGQSDPKTSFPPGFTGEGEVARLRPCEVVDP